MAITQAWVPVDGDDLPVRVSRHGGEGTAVAIFPSVFGITSDLEEQMEEIAELATVVVAFDPFFRHDPGPASYGEMERVKARIGATDRDRAQADFRAVIEWARGEEKWVPVVALGICYGGPFALLAAADGLVEGVVTWHGTRLEDHLDRASEMRCPMRHHFGAEDPIVPNEAVRKVRRAFEGRDDVRIVVHEGATHGFSHRSARQAYDEAAEKAGMQSLRGLVAQVSPSV